LDIDKFYTSGGGISKYVTHLLWKDKGFYREQGEDREKYENRIEMK